ncbi:type IV secretion system protein [Jiangella alkaliphila]|uniref:TrbL/VirB6 plasmid conjugal transfer protein n=1 Tax=Jiangella alkaliphila TaxID=419479 RepID=A0A1H2GD38_9ACTN|nr:type IV secretion system protein [Jiangella alkaliphila]SDU17475.1 TrbL/VirB6 plasmid conjugal transfer protein [Jiangella alkaliphila]
MIDRGACDLLVISWGCDLVGDAASGMAEDLITAVAAAVFGFAVTLLGWVWTAIEETTTPVTDADWLYEWAGRIFGITLPITVALLILQVITIVLRDGGARDGVGRAVARAGAAVFGTAVSLPVIHLLTSAVDALGTDLTAATFGDMDQVGDRLQQVFATVAVIDQATGGLNYGLLGGGSVIAGAVAFIIFGILLVLGAIAVWGALLVRSMLLYVVIVMGPIAIMGLAWQYTSGWFRSWIAVVNALVWTKLAVMVVFGLGVSAIAGADFGSDGPGAVGVLLSGALMMLMAALVPIACYSFMSFVGDEVHASVLHRGGISAAAAGRAAVARADPAQILRRTSRHGSTADDTDTTTTSDPRASRRPGIISRPAPTADQRQPAPMSATAAGGQARAGDVDGGPDRQEHRPRQTGWWPSSQVGDDTKRQDQGSARNSRASADIADVVDARGERAGGTPRAAATHPAPSHSAPVDVEVADEPPAPEPTHAADRLRAATADAPSAQPHETEHG